MEELYAQKGGYYLSDRIDFEKTKAHVYRNPTDDVMNAELLKMTILNENRKQYTCHDEHKTEPRNVLMAIPHCIHAKVAADKLAYFSSNTQNPISQKYFDFFRMW